MTIRIRFENLPGVSRRFDRKVSAIFKKWGTKQNKILITAYTVGGHQQHGGAAWAPRVKPAGHPILNRTGTLKRGTKFSFVKGRGAKIDFFNPVSYAKFHQFGTSRMTSRPLIVITQRDENRLTDKIKNIRTV